MIKRLMLSLAVGAMTSSVAYTASGGNVKGYYWIDSGLPVAFTAPPTEIETHDINDGFHTFNIVAYDDNGTCSSPCSTSFIKVPGPNASDHSLNGVLFLDGKPFARIRLRNAGGGTYSCDADVNSVSLGVHNIMLLAYNDAGTVSDVVDTWFLRIPTEAELSATKVAYFIDGNYIGQKELNRSGTIYLTDIDTQAFDSGVHSIDVSLVLPDGTLSSYGHSWFYRTPIPKGIAAYDYWFDNDCRNPETVMLDQVVSDYGFISMIDVPELPFDSRKYELSVDNGQLSVSGRHTLNMRFYETDGRAIYRTSDYTDSRSTVDVEHIASLCEGVNHVTTSNANEIKWYKFYGEIGDSIMICSDRPSMFELYSPLGKELVRGYGSQSQAHNTLTLMESGMYYFAAHNHDIESRADFNVSFSHVPRNAILSVSPRTNTRNSGFTMIDLFGNGMNDAKSIAMQSDDGFKLMTDSLFAWDNYHLSGTIVHKGEIPLGVYDVSMVITDRVTGEEKIITRQRALNIIDTTESPNIKVEVVPVKKASTPYMVDIFVTNDSDIPCWGIPFNIACERNGGRVGYVLSMKDFLGEPMSAEHLTWYESDDLLGTGTDGIVFPVVISSLQPREKRTLKVGIISEPHEHVGLYAWAGMPYSEERKELMSTPADSLNMMKIPYSNILDLKTVAYVLSALEEVDRPAYSASRIHPTAGRDDRVLELMRDYGPEIAGNYSPLETPSNYADRVAKVYNGVGETVAGITNAGPASHSYIQLEQRGIPGSTLSEKLRNVEIMYGGFDNIGPEASDIKYYYLQGKKELARAKSPLDIFADATDTSDWLPCLAGFIGRNCKSSNPMPTRHEIDCYQSGDPNMITGYSDPTGGNYIGIDVKTLDYTIEFENDPAIATASASTIVVENNFDESIFDLTSLIPKDIKIGKYAISVPESHHFVKTIDMRPQIQCIAEIRFDYEVETGQAIWRFTSLDPLTLDPVIDFRQGMLPVNDESGRGIGFIDYSISLKDDLPHNANVDNKAVIVFDDNNPIDTPTWSNITDYKRPKSTIVHNNGYCDGAYSLTVDYNDEGAGVYAYDLCIRTSDSEKWYVVKSGLTDRDVKFETPEEIPGIMFATIATDRAGNRQIHNDVVCGIVDADTVNGRDDSNPQIWYNLQGIPVSGLYNCKSNGVVISNKGQKVIIR